MVNEVKAGRVAGVTGAVVALYIAVGLTQWGVPDEVLDVVGAPQGIDREGGVQVRFQPAEGNTITVDLIHAGLDVVGQLRHGGLAIHAVRSSNYARSLAELGDVQVAEEHWTHDGVEHRVGYVTAWSRDLLERAYRQAVARGFVLPHGSTLGYEQGWRTYELEAAPIVERGMIESSQSTSEPSGDSTLHVVLTEAGASRWCEASRGLVGERVAVVIDEQIRSTWVIDAPICDRKLAIELGPMSQRELEAIASTLHVSGLPREGKVIDATLRPPASLTNARVLATLLLAGMGGLAGAVFAFAVLCVARPRWRTPPPRWEGSFPWRRLVVTLLAPAMVCALFSVQIPGLSMQFNLVPRGMVGIVFGFAVVEVVAISIPRLRWRRHDPRGRRALGRAAIGVALAFGLFHGYVGAEQLVAPSAEAPDVAFRVGAALAFAIITGLIALISRVIRAYGLGNGYGVWLLSAIAVPFLFAAVMSPGWLLGSSLAIVTALVIVIATVCLLRWQVGDEDTSPALRVPSSGSQALSQLGALVGWFAWGAQLAGVAWLDEAIAWFDDALGDRWVTLPGAFVFVVLWSWLLARPAVLRRVARHAGMVAPSWRTWARATLLTVAGLAVIVAASELGWARSGTALTVMVYTAVVLDLLEDVRARRGVLTSAWQLHQVQYLDVVERVLGEAAIPYHLHASHLRILHPFFGAWAPVHVLVPVERAAEANGRLGAVLRVPTQVVPVAQVRSA